MQITGGQITYGRTVQPAQYESKKAEATIAFVLSEGEEMGETLTKVKQIAMDVCHEMVGLKQPASDTTKVAAAAALNASDVQPKTTTRTPPKTKPPKDKAPEAVKDPAAIEDPKPNISITPEERKDPAAIEDDPLAVPASTITDAQINEAAMKKNGELKNPAAIRELIVKYVGKTPCRAVDIQAGVRQKFLDELEALGKKA